MTSQGSPLYLFKLVNEVHVGDLRENDNQTKSGLWSAVLSLSLLNFRELVFGENAFQVKIKTQTQWVDEVVKQETRHRFNSTFQRRFNLTDDDSSCKDSKSDEDDFKERYLCKYGNNNSSIMQVELGY